MRSLYALAWRNLKEHRLRTALSASAVALGTVVIIAADVVGGTLLSLHTEGFVAFAAEILDFGLTTVGVGILTAAGFLIFNAFAMTITQRRREIGAMRALGMARRQVMRLVLIEALVTGGLGALLGVVGGPLVGRAMVGVVRALAGDFFGSSVELYGASLDSILLAAALGLGVTLIATLVPAWQATRVTPLAALRPRSNSASRAPGGQWLGCCRSKVPMEPGRGWTRSA
jgi:putative ABC transport system permease protein